MPEISRFFGIVITMYWERRARHHMPHFHAIYGEYVCMFSIPGIEILQGSLPPRAMRLVKEWAKLHIDELQNNWEMALQEKPLKPINPLM